MFDKVIKTLIIFLSVLCVVLAVYYKFPYNQYYFYIFYAVIIFTSIEFAASSSVAIAILMSGAYIGVLVLKSDFSVKAILDSLVLITLAYFAGIKRRAVEEDVSVVSSFDIFKDEVYSQNDIDKMIDYTLAQLINNVNCNIVLLKQKFDGNAIYKKVRLNERNVEIINDIEKEQVSRWIKKNLEDWVLRTGESTLYEDENNMLLLPLLFGKKVLGLLYLIRDEKFSKKEIAFATYYADALSILQKLFMEERK